MAYITGSVGEGCLNRKQDVGIVQHLLNISGARHSTPNRRIAIDGIVGPQTIAAIREYQKRYCESVDGQIAPGGETIKWLAQTGHLPPLNDGQHYLQSSRTLRRFV